MSETLSENSERANQTRLGKALNGMRDRPFGDLKIRFRIDPTSKRPLYWLELVGGESNGSTSSCGSETSS